MQQERVQRRTVRRIDECAREQEARDHEEIMSRARRASKRAQSATHLVKSLLEEIDECVR
jgi:hypothetical protein